MYQIAKDIETDDDALADLLESIERFIGHINVYTQVPHTRNVDEMVVRIVLELLSTLALATKRLTQGRLSESVLFDTLTCSMQCSEICTEPFRRGGRRGGTAGFGPTHTR